MNEFTKEELQYLFNDVDNNCECFIEPEIAYVIRDKLKSMIDNYCDHEEKEVIQTVNHGSTFTNQCKKCGTKI